MPASSLPPPDTEWTLGQLQEALCSERPEDRLAALAHLATHRRALFGTARRMLGRRTLADPADAAHDSLIRVIEVLQSGRAHSDVLPRFFMLAVAARVTKENRRKERRLASKARNAEARQALPMGGAEDDAEAQLIEVETKRERKRLGQQAMECLEKLTPQRRELFYGHVVEERTRSELAELHHLTVGHVDKQIGRAKKGLGTCLEKNGVRAAGASAGHEAPGEGGDE